MDNVNIDLLISNVSNRKVEAKQERAVHPEEIELFAARRMS